GWCSARRRPPARTGRTAGRTGRPAPAGRPSGPTTGRPRWSAAARPASRPGFRRRAAGPRGSPATTPRRRAAAYWADRRRPGRPGGCGPGRADRRPASAPGRRRRGSEPPASRAPAARSPCVDPASRPVSGSSAARRFYEPGQDWNYQPPVTTLLEVERPPRVRRRRRALGLSLMVLLALLLGLNGALALRDAFTVGGSVARVIPSGTDGFLGLFTSDVRVLRFTALRRVANAIKGPVRVGLQVGHLGAADQPEELASLRTSTGGHWNGVDEVTVNLAVVEALAERLAGLGFEVDVLTAAGPPGYRPHPP